MGALRKHSVRPLFSIYTEKQDSAGEDAPPLIVYDPKHDSMAVGVFDGLGGSGAVKYRSREPVRSGAYWASRIAAQVCKEQLRQDPEIDSATLGRSILDRFQVFDSEHGSPRSGLRSSMIKVLPTTMALAVVDFRRSSDSRIRCMWAGDSRLYILSPVSGLQQLTADDLVVPADPMENLLTDGRMSNCISLEGDFNINSTTANVDPSAPALIFAATDGCFGYFPSPMHFEHALLSTLSESDTTSDWQRRLSECISAVAQDDATLALLSYGFDNRRIDQTSDNVVSLVSEIQLRFQNRFEFLTSHYIQPLDRIRELEPSAHSDLRTDLWCHYRAGYLRSARPAPVGRS